MTDDLGERMKGYEAVWAGDRLGDVGIPVLARIDGRHFHAFTRGLSRPYDEGFGSLMQRVTRQLVVETGACCGYVQSDEISLVWLKESPEQQIFFDGREHKMVSQLAALASVYFFWGCGSVLGSFYQTRFPTFDCRVWTVPLLVEAANYFVWREMDAVRNSVNMLAQAHFSHRQLLNKGIDEARAMLREKGVYWSSQPEWFRRGSYYQRRRVLRRFTADEMILLPEKHEAHRNPDLIVERSEVRALDIPMLLRIENRIGVLLRGEDAEPIELSVS